jgi:hypothetical protein
VNEINFGCGEVKKDNEWVCDWKKAKNRKIC